jgi:hypothetical protein
MPKAAVATTTGSQCQLAHNPSCATPSRGLNWDLTISRPVPVVRPAMTG